MYLKRLELKGFKSFPVKTDILFKEGITAIVGPNGSGKSNISDAVRWVLGEQSIKSLRGDKLEDVIFAGTDTKKPMNYCEVSLTIDNSDEKLDVEYSEITIKRRAYRNGESSFFLNNKSCRLKDIREILLDTGIGKDGYSIIEQGKVDEILSNNPMHRRRVFDEACGISKYRYKKQEAERNLRHTKENLERINDIYVEIENQLKPLYTQQLKAKKYIDLSEQLKTIEVNSFIKDIEGLQVEIKEVDIHNNLLTEESNNIEKQKSIVENSINDTNQEINKMDDSINKVIDYINSIKMVISKKESELNIINERIKNINNDIENKNQEIVDLKGKLSKDELESQLLVENKQKNESKLKEINNKVNELRDLNGTQRLKIDSLNEKVENLKDEIIQLLNEKQEASNKLSTLNANNQNIVSRKNTIEVDINDNNIKIKEKNSEINKVNIEIEDKNQKLLSKKNELTVSNNKLLEIIKINEELEKNIQNSKYNLNTYKSKLNIYVEMENHHEGFNRGVKEVLRNKNLPGINGALGQVLTVPEKYEKSIEAALGAYMQNIITNDEYSAKQAINYLKKNNLGRVTFLPMNVIRSNKINTNNVKSTTQYIGLASDLISYDEKYRNIFENILGRTLIIDNIDSAIKLAKETNHKFKIVTLDGEILNPGGSLTGGSLKTNGNILSRKRFIIEFKEKIEDTNKVIQNLNKEKEIKLNEQIVIQKNIKEINEFIQVGEKDLIIDKSNLDRLKQEQSSFNIVIEKLTNEKEGLDSNLDYTIEKTNIIKEELDKINKKHEENSKKISEYTLNMKMNETSYNENKNEFDTLNLELVKYKQVQSSFEKDISRLKNDKGTQLFKLEKLKQLLEEQKIEITRLEEQIVIEKTERENLDKQLTDNSRNLENKREFKEGLKQQIEVKNKELRTVERNYLDIKESLYKIQGRLERLKASQDSYINKLFEEYELTVVQALEIKDDSIDIDKKKLETIKREVRNLGNVNIDSIKEYEEVKERYDFYNEQKNDLEESTKAIEELITELEKNMKIEFEVKFNDINEKFKYVYTRLFGGGYGELIILDKDNILESDIEIIAQPPGKKMKNLNLLSGGEKALTAISILFSILLTKPTPFCILDEIEAPLDDANIYRFGEFLKELAQETQFISVTHRRGTMQAADYIYGVTMQEKAISKVISLKLNEAEQMTDVI